MDVVVVGLGGITAISGALTLAELRLHFQRPVEIMFTSTKPMVRCPLSCRVGFRS